MATFANGSVPAVKVEGPSDGRIKEEPMDIDTVPYMDDQDDEGGDLDFTNAKKELWLGHVPRNLWHVLSKLGTMNDDEEIEIGTIRAEGPETNPQRVSLLFNSRLPQFANQHKEYNLFETATVERRSKHQGDTLIFSEQDVDGYKPRKFNFDDVDEEGNPSQAISRLFANYKRSQINKKRKAEKENDPDGAQPPQRKIPKKTAMQGVVAKEFDLRPVKNEEYLRIEAVQAGSMLHQKKKQEAVLIKSLDDVLKMEGVQSQQKATRDAFKKKEAVEKQARKDKQFNRMETHLLQSILHRLFTEYRVWKMRDLKAETKVPETQLREVLPDMAFQHSKGDWSGMWEMQQSYRDLYLADMQGQLQGEMAPERSDAEMIDDDEDNDEEKESFVSALNER